jgi:D-glycero-D-manno-heptose 1,7-bisphosphate phosphatase
MFAETAAVFLDRDGVLNKPVVVDGKPLPPQTPDEFELIPGVLSATTELKDAGFLLIVVTNQPDVARGTQSRDMVDCMHERLSSALPVDEILVCWHDDKAGCDCRKPRAGLFHSAARKHRINLSNSFMVGDRWRDIEAGSAAGCQTLMIDYGYSEKQPAIEPTVRINSLREAADWILVHARRNNDDTSE